MWHAYRIGSGVLSVGDVRAALLWQSTDRHGTSGVRTNVWSRSVSAAESSDRVVEERPALSRLFARRAARASPPMFRKKWMQRPHRRPGASAEQPVLQGNGEIHGRKLHMCGRYDCWASVLFCVSLYTHLTNTDYIYSCFVWRLGSLSLRLRYWIEVFIVLILLVVHVQQKMHPTDEKACSINPTIVPVTWWQASNWKTRGSRRI